MSKPWEVWTPRLISVGKLGSHPIVLATATAAQLTDVKIESRLLSYDSLPSALSILQTAMDRFVPSRETATDWQNCFKQFRELHPGCLEQQWQSFTALLYARTKLPAGTKGALLVSSVHTYLKYVAVGDLMRLRFMDCFRAVETQAGSIGSTHIAPRANAGQVELILAHIADPTKEFVDRMGLWLQCHGGGRTIDAARIRHNGIDWTETGGLVRGVIWRWGKNISKAGHTQYSPSLSEVLEAFGPPPVTQEEWKEVCSANEYPLKEYCSSRVNALLKDICKDASPMPKSTSLRDLCHQVLAKKFDCNAEAMVRHTPHRSTKAMKANYIATRPTSVSKTTGSQGKSARKSKTVKAKKTRRTAKR